MPDGVARVIDTMTAKKPDARYQTAAEACFALLPFADRPERVEGRPPVAAPAPEGERPRANWRLWGR